MGRKSRKGSKKRKAFSSLERRALLALATVLGLVGGVEPFVGVHSSVPAGAVAIAALSVLGLRR